MTPAIDPPDLPPFDEAELDGGELVLCATERLAAELRRRHDLRQAATGARHWRTLDARSPARWLDRLAEDRLLSGLPVPPELRRPVLDAFQARLLWERVIADSLADDAAPLFDLGALAATAAEADELALVWDITPGDGPAYSEECRRFAAWRADYLATCARLGVVDATRVRLATVAALAADLATSWPARVVLAGFDRLTPPEARLLAAIGADRVHLLRGEPAPAPRVAVRSLPDRAAECRAVAAWARARLAADPDARLGVVAPDLAGVRDALQDALEDALMPAAARPALAEAARPFNFSLGRPLTAWPIVARALDLLRLAVWPERARQTELGALFNDPYWSASQTEADARARLEAAMRRDLAATTRLTRVAAWVAWRADRDGQDGRDALVVPGLRRHLGALAGAAARWPARARPSVWAAGFRKTLTRAGWPGERALSSHEFQARQALFEAFDAFAGLDRVAGELDAPAALARLGQLCRQRVFQPRTENQPRVQVLGVLEAAGMRFDGLWVLGMTDQVWPPAPRPNPLLPAEAQRRARAPHASAEVETAFASAIQARLLASCAPRHAATEAPDADVILSWPRLDGATETRPSPLLAVAAPADCWRDEDAPMADDWIATALADAGAALAPPLEDAQAPPVAAGERVPGGTWLLRAQAICPAWAYYRYRLGAAPLETPVDGLDPARRGSLVHRALEMFWSRIGDSASLQVLDADGLRAAIEAAVEAALDDPAQAVRGDPLPPRFRALERRRMIRLLDGWLALERGRPAPFVVQAVEREVSLEIGEIGVRTFIDRIDRLEDGRLVVIDYKTGSAIDTRNWASDRVTEPQLPIYAALAAPVEGEVAALAFAKVLLADPAFAGLAEEDGLLPGVGALDAKPARRTFPAAEFPDWPALLEHWRRALHAIAREIAAGEAGVRVADERALAWCEVLPLLRLPERRAGLTGAGR